MRFSLPLLPAAFALLITTSPTPAATLNEVITSAAQAASKFQTISYHVTFTQETGKPDSYFSITGDVTLTHASSYLGLPKNFYVNGATNNPGAVQPSRFSLGFTGPTLRIINHADKTYFDVPSSEDAPADHLGLYLLEPYFIDGTAPSIPASDSGMTAALGKSEDINGVTCHHVIIKQKIDPDASAADKSDSASPPLYATIHEYFAASDFLLRKRVSEIPPLHAGSPATDGPITRTFLVSNIKIDPDIDHSVFNPEIPESYAQRKPDGLDSPDAKIRVGDPAPDWDAKDPQGNTHTLSQYKGKVILMDFWATWCGPCKAAMPGIQKLYDKFKDQDFVAFGLSVNDQGDPAGYMKSKNFTYTCLLNGENVIGPYGVGPLPQFFLVGRDGKIIYHSAGFDDKQEEKLSSIIQSALDAK